VPQAQANVVRCRDDVSDSEGSVPFVCFDAGPDQRHFNAARLLIETGADVNIRSTAGFGGKTARSLKESLDGGEIVELLEKRGAGP
jgi:hypothetical protein